MHLLWSFAILPCYAAGKIHAFALFAVTCSMLAFVHTCAALGTEWVTNGKTSWAVKTTITAILGGIQILCGCMARHIHGAHCTRANGGKHGCLLQLLMVASSLCSWHVVDLAAGCQLMKHGSKPALIAGFPCSWLNAHYRAPHQGKELFHKDTV